MPKRFVKAGATALAFMKLWGGHPGTDLEAERILIDDGLAAHTLTQDSKATYHEITSVNQELANDALESEASDKVEKFSHMPFGIEQEVQQDGTDPKSPQEIQEDLFEMAKEIEDKNDRAEIKNREEAIAAAEADQQRAGAIVENQRQAEAGQHWASATADDQGPGQHQAAAAAEDQDPGQHWASATADDQGPGQHQAAAAAEDQDPGQHWASATADDQGPGQHQAAAAAEDQDPGQHQAAAATEPDIWLEDDADVHDPDVD